MAIDPRISLAVESPPIDMAGAFQKGQANALALQHQRLQLETQRQTSQSLAEDRQAQAEERKAKTAQLQQGVTSQQAIDHLMQNAFVEDPQAPGVYTLNRSAITQAAIQGGNGHLLPQIHSSLDKLDESLKKTNSARNQTLAEAIYGVQENGNTPGAVQAAAAMLAKNNLVDPTKLQPLLDAVDQHQSPEVIGAIMQHLGQGIPEYRALVESEATKKAALSKTTAEARKVNAEATNLETYGHATKPEHKLVEVTEPDGSQGFRVFNGTTLLPLSAEGVGPKRPAQTPEPMQLKEVTGPDGALALANYNPRSGQLSPVQAPGFAPKQPTQPAAAPPNMRTVNVVVDGQPKVATFNPQTGRLTVDGEDITGRAAPMQAPQTGPNLQRAEVEVDGQPAVANFNPRAGTYTDPSGADISARVRPKSASEASGSDFEKFLGTYARDQGKTAATLTAKDRLAARHAWAQADDKPKDPLAQELAQQRLEAGREKLKPMDITPDVQTTVSGAKYIDGSQIPTQEREKARKAAAADGVVMVSKEQAAALQEIDNARLNQKAIMDQIAPLLPKDALGRIVSAPGTKLSSLLQTNEQKAAFSSWRAAAINSLRATAGSKGLRINQAEIQLALENDIPKLTDTLGVAKQKVANINTMLDNAERPITVHNRSTSAAPAAAPAPSSNGPAAGVFSYQDYLKAKGK